MAAKPIPVDYITGIWTYLLSIDWEETWLWVLMTFHLWCAVFTLLSIVYKKYYPQIVLFLFYLGLAFCSQYINEWASRNYKLFSNQQYFDSRGMFISLLFSLPLLCNSLVIVVYWMWDVTQAMIKLKQVKVKHAKRIEKQRQELKETDGSKDTDQIAGQSDEQTGVTERRKTTPASDERNQKDDEVEIRTKPTEHKKVD